MLLSNTIKIVGCLMMLFGTHPLMAYAIVGLGAPRRTHPPVRHPHRVASRLTAGQSQWLDRGLTIASIILGVLLGGQLVGHAVSTFLLSFDFPLHRHRRRHAARSSHFGADLCVSGCGLVQYRIR